MSNPRLFPSAGPSLQTFLSVWVRGRGWDGLEFQQKLPNILERWQCRVNPLVRLVDPCCSAPRRIIMTRNKFTILFIKLCWIVYVVKGIHRKDILPYGPLSGDLTLQEGDDETSKVIVLTRPMHFYEASFPNLYVSPTFIMFLITSALSVWYNLHTIMRRCLYISICINIIIILHYMPAYSTMEYVCTQHSL